MEINLPDDLVEMFQECVDTVDSYTVSKKPQAIKEFCVALSADLNLSTALAMPSYLALALLGAVRFKDEKRCIFKLNQGELPSWQNIQIKKDSADLVKQVRKQDDAVAKNAVVVAFCLSRAEQVKNMDILRFKSILQTNGGEDDDQWIEG
jgi:hypothetical protein